MSTRSEHQTVPLSVLLKRELLNERIECPELVHGQGSQSKKGEDYTLIKTECQRVVGDGVSTYSVFGVWFLLLCVCVFRWFIKLISAFG
jgi:hypothetical protein